MGLKLHGKRNQSLIELEGWAQRSPGRRHNDRDFLQAELDALIDAAFQVAERAWTYRLVEKDDIASTTIGRSAAIVVPPEAPAVQLVPGHCGSDRVGRAEASVVPRLVRRRRGRHSFSERCAADHRPQPMREV